MIIRNSNSRTLFDAIFTEQFDEVHALIQNGSDVNSVNSTGSTALIEAARIDNIDLIKYLLHYGATINHPDGLGLTAFSLAAMHRHMNTLQLLIEKQADINVKDSFGDTVLIDAVRGNRVEIVKLLLENKAKVDSANKLGYTAFMIAVNSGKLPIVNLLLQNGAKIEDFDEFLQLLKSFAKVWTYDVDYLMELSSIKTALALFFQQLENKPSAELKMDAIEYLNELNQVEYHYQKTVFDGMNTLAKSYVPPELSHCVMEYFGLFKSVKRMEENMEPQESMPMKNKASSL